MESGREIVEYREGCRKHREREREREREKGVSLKMRESVEVSRRVRTPLGVRQILRNLN